MTEQPTSPEPLGWPILDIWNKYEDVAMHFNDLLIRLRTQALAGVAAVSTLVGIFTKTSSPGNGGTWEIAAFVMFALCVLWIAIWILDLGYYNRLLIGSVAAILILEKLSEKQSYVTSLSLSTTIADAVAGVRPLTDAPTSRFILLKGVWVFYGLVLCILFTGFFFCLMKYRCASSLPS